MLFKYSTYLVRFVICCLKYGVINDELYDRIRCLELRKWHYRGSNLQNFPGGMPPDPLIMRGFGVRHGQGFRLDPRLSSLI
jgi:hypothetical protein